MRARSGGGRAGATATPRWLELLDRYTDMINIQTIDYAPSTIEAVVRAHPLVREAAACAIPTAAGGENEVWVAVVRAAPPTSADDTDVNLVDALKAHTQAAEQLPWTVRPKGVVVLDALPLTPAYKLDRKRVAALALEAREKQGAAA